MDVWEDKNKQEIQKEKTKKKNITINNSNDFQPGLRVFDSAENPEAHRTVLARCCLLLFCDCLFDCRLLCVSCLFVFSCLFHVIVHTKLQNNPRGFKKKKN